MISDSVSPPVRPPAFYPLASHSRVRRRRLRKSQYEVRNQIHHKDFIESDDSTFYGESFHRVPSVLTTQVQSPRQEVIAGFIKAC